MAFQQPAGAVPAAPAPEKLPARPRAARQPVLHGGFITVINNTLLPHLRSVFDLDYTRTTLIESVWFIAYFVASIPSARLIERIGYQRSLVAGLLVMAAGSAGMMLAASIPSYGVTLAMLFVIASGITLLQVAANPYVAVVGRPETASSRLNLVQAMKLGRDDARARIRRLADPRAVERRYIRSRHRADPGRAVRRCAVGDPALWSGRRGAGHAGARDRALPASRHGRRNPSPREGGAPPNHSLWKHRNLVFGVRRSSST
ncbi:major facilitator superfamily domain-containing protein [Ditylenchus destructor]|uniref:Major facilitator superfamily domain-containing protein n=1 Tax=Ditylenchus destructor TaxID=166010 RepID=A0AAD4MIK6_9BILA|nr:major facilitator superfamily domain-containing protein [Ditylenchus destructor]